jgi:hypothetical protein
MTYAELLTELSTLSPEQLKQDVTVYLSDIDETYPASFIFNTDEDMGEALDTVDIGHPLISA